jgi:hypothetical protein
MYHAIDGLTDAELDALPGGPSAAAREGSNAGSGSSAHPRGSKRSKVSGGSRVGKGPSSVVVGSAVVGGSSGRRGGSAVQAAAPPEAVESRGGSRKLLFAIPFVICAVVGAVVVMKMGGASGDEPKPIPVNEEPVVLIPGKPTKLPKPPEADPGRGVVDPPPAEQAQPDPGSVLVKLVSVPAGAAVLQDGVQIGMTPLKRPFRRDAVHTVTFQLSGYSDASRSFRLSSDDTVEVALEKAIDARQQSRNGPSKPKRTNAIPVFE